MISEPVVLEVLPHDKGHAQAEEQDRALDQVCTVKAIAVVRRHAHWARVVAALRRPSNTALSCKRRIDEAREARIKPPLVSCSALLHRRVGTQSHRRLFLLMSFSRPPSRRCSLPQRVSLCRTQAWRATWPSLAGGVTRRN